MTEDTLLPFGLPAVKRKKVTADFEGGLISSDGGLVLLRGAERRLGLAEALAGCIREWRDPALVVHTLPAMLRFRMFAIACGYEDDRPFPPCSSILLAYGVADDLKVRRAEAGAEKMRSFAAFDYAAGSWNRERRVVARLEASARGFDARYIVTSLGGDARHLYEDIYCARGQAENLIKLHKGQLASDRTSCQSPIANQFRLVLHTAAYWLMLALRDAVPRRMPLAWAEFATLRARLLKIGARVVEKAARRPVPPAGRASRRRRPLSAGAPCPANPSPFNPKPRHYQPQPPARKGAERQPTRA